MKWWNVWFDKFNFWFNCRKKREKLLNCEFTEAMILKRISFLSVLFILWKYKINRSINLLNWKYWLHNKKQKWGYMDKYPNQNSFNSNNHFQSNLAYDNLGFSNENSINFSSFQAQANFSHLNQNHLQYQQQQQQQQQIHQTPISNLDNIDLNELLGKKI